MDTSRMSLKQKEEILSSLQEWMYIDYGDEEFFICPLCGAIVDLPQEDPEFVHLRSCPFLMRD